jgi:hypothetical protein
VFLGEFLQGLQDEFQRFVGDHWGFTSVGEKFSVVAIDKYNRTASGTWGGADVLRKFCQERTRRSATRNRKGKSCL